ncbi:hypothetical protein DPMN_134886 [Dreissena polymorpha]|uniref:Uncharacterized protein n=1 Tax=Dreissena polymorpha TaxID=45954 RepID=A0A9D4G0R8_DREPO|nr:hypothetical protein DPMN_134886 [Dreissena polymorpha]
MFDPGGAPGLVMGPCIVEIDFIVIRDVQYQFEVNPCRNEEVYFQGSSAYSVGGDIQYQYEVNLCRNDEVNEIVARTDRQTDRRTTEITTISPRFSKSFQGFSANSVGGDSGQDGQPDRRRR